MSGAPAAKDVAGVPYDSARDEGQGGGDGRPRRILLVEDSSTLSILYQQYLRQAGFDVTAVANGRDAISALSDSPAAVALDLGLPDIDGMSVLKHIRTLDPPPATVIITGDRSVVSAIEAMRLGAYDYIVKPATPEHLAGRIRSAIDFGTAAGRTKPGIKPDARRLSFIGARGGVGATSIAVHAALLAAASNKRSSCEACIVDLDLLNGSCAEYLDVQPAWNLDEIIPDPSRLDGRMVELMTSSHKQGVSVISTQRKFGERFDFLPAIVTRTLDIAAEKYRTVIIDLPRHDEGWSDAVIRASSEVFVVTDYSMPGLRAAHRMIDDLAARHGTDLKVRVIVNKYSHSFFGKVIPAVAVRDLLGDKVAGFVISDDRLVREAIDRGLPATDIKARNLFVSDIAKILGY